MTGRTFVVKVSESPHRVVVEDVRTQRRMVVPELDAIGSQIACWLRESGGDPTFARERDDWEYDPGSRDGRTTG